MIKSHRQPFWPRLFAVALGYWMLCHASQVFAATVSVSVGDNFFLPASTNITVNDSVKWTWIGGISHSSTSDAGDSTTWDSGIIGNGSMFTRQFTAAGSFPYHCNVHSGQLGTITVQAANNPPAVSITNPANGAMFSAPAAFTLQATASDPGGSVASVQFKQGTTVLTNKTSAPYFVAITNLAAGAYSFFAIATDNLGAKATNSISVTVNQLPTVALTNPANGAVFSAPAKLTISASAADDGAITNVQFLQNGVVFTNRAVLPYSVTLSSLAPGAYALSAVAADNLGGKATNVISVNVVTAGAIILSSPQQVSGTNFQFKYSANTGLRYVVEQSSNLASWSPLNTNTAAGNPVTFVHTNAVASPGFYRVGRLPNP